MSREQRQAAICALEKERGETTVISYITSTRQNAESQMGMDAIDPIYENLRALAASRGDIRVDLFIHSNGGDGVVPWRLVTLIREFCEEFTVLVPNRAFSAATLTALGATRVIMHPMGMLGPTDPTVGNAFNPIGSQGQMLGISVEDVASYIALVKEDVGIGHEDELIQAFIALTNQVHPLALGNVKRSTLQSRMMGEKLLRRRVGGCELSDHQIENVVRKLTSELFFHGHPINRREAREDVGLTFVEDATPAVADRMWDLYELYSDEMQLRKPFQPLQEAIAISPLEAADPQVMGPNLAKVSLGSRVAIVESNARADVYDNKYEVVLMRDAGGNYNANVTLVDQGWATEA